MSALVAWHSRPGAVAYCAPMKRVVLIGGALVVSGIAVVALTSGDGDACPTEFEFDGRTYVAYGTTAEVVPRNSLGPGTESGCGDAGAYSSEIAAYSVLGVPPEVAVVSAINSRAIYIARDGRVSDLPSDVAAVVVD